MSEDKKDKIDFDAMKKKHESLDKNLSRNMIIVGGVGIILVVFIWASFISETFMFEKEFEFYSESQCEGVIMEGKAIIARNNGSEDYSEYSDEDRTMIVALEDEFLTFCMVDKTNTMNEFFDDCKELLVDWHKNTDSQASPHKETWDFEALDKDSNFVRDYYIMNCDLIQDEIIASDHYQNHMKSEHSDEEDT